MKVEASEDIEKTCRATTPAPSGYFLVNPQGKIPLSISVTARSAGLPGT
jgi:hypothetical protein